MRAFFLSALNTRKYGTPPPTLEPVHDLRMLRAEPQNARHKEERGNGCPSMTERERGRSAARSGAQPDGLRRRRARGVEVCRGARSSHRELRVLSRQRRERTESADKPGSVVDSHSSRRIVADTLKQPTRRHRGPRHCLPIWSCSRWGLPCRSVAGLAVRSYRTISPLPVPRHPFVAESFPKTWPAMPTSVRRLPPSGGDKGVTGPSAVSFCCTFRRLAPPRRYLAPCPMEPGLSSAPSSTEMAAGDATAWPTPSGIVARSAYIEPAPQYRSQGQARLDDLAPLSARSADRSKTGRDRFRPRPAPPAHAAD